VVWGLFVVEAEAERVGLAAVEAVMMEGGAK